MPKDHSLKGRRDPNDCEIAAGYFLTNLRHHSNIVYMALSYAGEHWIKMGRDVLVNDEQRATAMQFSKALRLLREAGNATHLVGEAHDSLREVIKDAGVRSITNEDFAEFEASIIPSEYEQEVRKHIPDDWDVCVMRVDGALFVEVTDNYGTSMKMKVGGGGGR